MFYPSSPTSNPNGGINVDPITVHATFQAAGGVTNVAVGMVLGFDPADASLVQNPYAANSRYVVAKVPATAFLVRGIFGVVTKILSDETINGARVELCIAGRCRVTTDGAVAAGDLLVPKNATAVLDETGDVAAAAKIVAIAEVDDVGTECDVLFNGVTGFGFDS